MARKKKSHKKSRPKSASVLRREKSAYLKLTPAQKSLRSRELAARRMREGPQVYKRPVEKPRAVKSKTIHPRRLAVTASSALAERRKLLREYREFRTTDTRRERIRDRTVKLATVIEKTRKSREAIERDALMAREHVKQLRPYIEGYESKSGYDLRRPKDLTPAQRKRIEKDWLKLVPVLSKEHIRVRFKDTREQKLLAEFQGLKKLPQGIKAIPITTPTPDTTTVEITADGQVLKHRGRIVERYFFLTAAEKRGMRRSGGVESAARSLLARMPAGMYFALTGEHEAFQNGLQHDGPDSANDPDNLLLRQIQSWIGYYKATVPKWFRGFRWIGTVNDDNATFREQRRIIKQRTRLQRERSKKQHEIGAVSRKRARRDVPIK